MQTFRNPYPRQLIIDIHSYCNASCVICPYTALKKQNPMGIMEEGLFEKIVRDFGDLTRKHGFRGNVLFCNMSEIFVYPEMAAQRLQYVIQSGLGAGIQTNAALMTPEAVSLLSSAGFDGTFTISLHGISPDVYKRVMGLDISTTLKNIDYLVQHYPKEKIVIQSIPWNWPEGEAKRIRSHFRSRGVRVRMPLANNRAGLLPNVAVHRKEKLAGCNAGRPLGEMVVCFDGDVILCCNDMGREEVVGNLRNNTIQEVWNGEKMQEKIGQIYYGKQSPDDFICRKCEFGITSNAPWKRLARNAGHEARKFILTRLR